MHLSRTKRLSSTRAQPWEGGSLRGGGRAIRHLLLNENTMKKCVSASPDDVQDMPAPIPSSPVDRF